MSGRYAKAIQSEDNMRPYQLIRACYPQVVYIRRSYLDLWANSYLNCLGLSKGLKAVGKYYAPVLVISGAKRPLQIAQVCAFEVRFQCNCVFTMGV
jgi:hypothetical protein